MWRSKKRVSQFRLANQIGGKLEINQDLPSGVRQGPQVTRKPVTPREFRGVPNKAPGLPAHSIDMRPRVHPGNASAS